MIIDIPDLASSAALSASDIFPLTQGAPTPVKATLGAIGAFVSTRSHLATRAALRALSATDYPSAVILEAGFKGTYTWDPGSHAAILLGSAIASSAVDAGTDTITSVAHGLVTQSAVVVTTAINGLSTNTIYWAIWVSYDAFKLAASRALAIAGTPVDLTAASAMTVKEHFDPDQVRYVIQTGGQLDGSAGAWIRASPTYLDIANAWDDSFTGIANLGKFYERNYFSNRATGKVNRFGRVFVGIAALEDGNRPIVQATWINSLLGGQMVEGAQFIVAHAFGGVASVGLSRSSDYRTAFGSSTGGAQGCFFGAWNDDAGGNAIACGVQGMTRHNAGITGISECAEFSIWNDGVVVSFTPKNRVVSNTTMGVNISHWIGATTNASLAIHIGGNVGGPTRWLCAIGVSELTLDLTMGSGGGGLFARLPSGASTQWMDSANAVVAELWGDADGMKCKGPTGPTRNLQKTWEVIAHSAVAVSHTGDINETVLATIAIAANRMGANGIIKVTSTWSHTNNANNKTMRIRLGGLAGTALLNTTVTTTLTSQTVQYISNRNSALSQVSFTSATMAAFTTTTGGLATASQDTAAPQDLVLTGLLANAGDMITLERYVVEVYYQA